MPREIISLMSWSTSTKFEILYLVKVINVHYNVDEKLILDCQNELEFKLLELFKLLIDITLYTRLFGSSLIKMFMRRLREMKSKNIM